MSEEKTHWRACDKTDFLGSADLEDLLKDGQTDLVLVIKFVEIKEVRVRGKKEVCRVATFTAPGVKPMIINVGNGKILKKFANNSKHIEDWINIPVSIYVNDNVRLGSETTEGLRFRPVQPRIEKPELTPDHKAWEKAVKAVKDGKIEAVKDRYKISNDNLEILLTDAL